MDFSKISENDMENLNGFFKGENKRMARGDDKEIKATPTLVIIIFGCIFMSLTMGIIGFEFWLKLEDLPNAIGFWTLSIVILIPSCHLSYILLKSLRRQS
ncbi:unnamed protein product [Blepharisma stoltei]|uniref:Uncharacterized protein n=1 Tax=Blepharisma stoltei TaxID=1481888 RepID=A0AAU9IPU2_9CILI|nr:unnamed protein product [Blepharisma stoltei]